MVKYLILNALIKTNFKFLLGLMRFEFIDFLIYLSLRKYEEEELEINECLT